MTEQLEHVLKGCVSESDLDADHVAALDQQC